MNLACEKSDHQEKGSGEANRDYSVEKSQTGSKYSRDHTNDNEDHKKFEFGATGNHLLSAAGDHAPIVAYCKFEGNAKIEAKSYLDKLLSERERLNSLPTLYELKHVRRLVDDRIKIIRGALEESVNLEQSGKKIVTGVEKQAGGDAPRAQPKGNVTVIQKKVFVPTKDYPDYNFVGRILGPRGITVKQLEAGTGCTILLRGRGSSRENYTPRGKNSSANVEDELHVVIQCKDVREVAEAKVKQAADCVRTLLTPPPEGEDELKRKQLMELAIINGTFRPTFGIKNCKMRCTPTNGLFETPLHRPSALKSSLLFNDATVATGNTNVGNSQLSANINGIAGDINPRISNMSMGYTWNGQPSQNLVEFFSTNSALVTERYAHLADNTNIDPRCPDAPNVQRANFEQFTLALSMLSDAPPRKGMKSDDAKNFH